MVLNLLKSITIKQRLIGLGCICVLGFVAVFTLLIFTERTLRQASEQVATMVQTSKVVDHIAVLLLSAEIEATRALIIDGSDDAEIVNGLLEDASGDVERLLGLSSASVIQENGKKLGANLAEFKDVFAKGYEVKDKLANGKVSLSERNDLRFQLEQWNKALHDVRLAIDEPLGSLALAIEEAEEAVNETAAAQKELAVQVLYAVFAAVVLAVTLSIALIARSILKPIGFLSTTMRRLAADEREIELPDQDRKDEFGDMNRAVAVFVESAEERRKLERESSEADQQTRERQEKVDQLIQGFRANVNNVLAMVEESMGQVDQTASSLIELSESSSTQTSRANDASQEAATRSEAVAASSDEVSASIQDISLQLKEAHGEIEAAVHTAQTANNEVGSLQGAAREIGQVISLISDIAEQTNLLALNATIEAARAGEAGRGFAVVASEVKSLASQTAKATNEISEKISSIQNATDKAADSIGRIAGTMENVTNHTASISGAVEQQNGAAMEISENVSAAASGTRSVQENISTVREAVEETNKSAEHMRRSSREMLDRTEHLKREVETFLHEVAAA